MNGMELDPIDHLTTDAIGPPGGRVFYIQTSSAGNLVTILVEKQQVQLLAASILEVLSRTDRETDLSSDTDMSLQEPVEPLFRAGRLSIGYEEDLDRVLLEIEELLPVEDEDGEPDRIRLWATREQVMAFSLHATAVSERGRPACELCGNPKDPSGHACPATNGHRKHTAD